MKNPLVLFTGAALATLAALAGLNMTVWRGSLSDSQKPAEAASQAADTATPSAEHKPSNGATGGTPDKPSDQAGKTPEKPTEMAAIPAPEPSKAESPGTGPELDTVRVESDGQAIVAGRAEPGAEVSLKLGEQVIGKGVANSEGAWVVVPDQALPKGPSEITIEQKIGDSAPVAAEQSIAVAIPEQPGQQAMVALTEPGTATKVLQAGGNQEQASLTQADQLAAAEKPVEPAQASTLDTPAKTPEPAPETTVAKVEVPDAVAPRAETTPPPAPAGENIPLGLAAVDYNDKGDIIFSGRAKPGTAARLYVDNRAVGDAMVDPAGNWSFAGKDIITPGTHGLRVDQIDHTGKVVARIELPFVRENAEAVAALNAPAPPVKTEAQAEAPAAQPTPEASVQPAAETPVQPTAELPAPKAVEPPAQQTAEPSTQQVAEQPQTTPSQTTAEPPKTAAAAVTAEKTAEQQTQASAPEPSKVEAAELPQASEVQKTEPAAPAAASDQPAAGDKKQELATVTPGAEPAKAAGADKPRVGKIVIQPGNNLWKLSRVIYGRGKNYTVIYQANKDQIRNPRRIYPGQIFATPGALPPEKIDPKRKDPLTSAEGGAVIQ